MRFIYTCIVYLLVPAVFLRLTWLGFKNRDYWRRWHERLGFVDLPGSVKPRVWLHAVSVGEVQAAVPLVQQLGQEFPHYELLVTTVTPTGYDMLRRRLDCGILHTYLPYDLPGAVRRFLDRVRPALLIVMETEIWPNLYHQCAARHIPVLLANARLSEKSYSGYKRFLQFTREVLNKIGCIAVQSEADAGRFKALGVEPGTIVITGNLKFDVEVPISVIAQGQSLKRLIGAGRPIWIAASTHAGEEEIVLAAQRRIIEMIPGCLLILAPRHPERCAGVLGLCQQSGYHAVRKSALKADASDSQILLLDTIGELPVYYAASDVAFVGGSLLPGMGGHNMLEPVILGVPVITGKYTSAFMEIARKLFENQAACYASGSGDLAEQVLRLLTDEVLKKQMVAAGREFIRQNQGATRRVMQLVENLLPARE